MSHEMDFSFLDKPEILEVVFPVVYSPFHFQADYKDSIPGAGTHFIEVEQGIKVGCGFWAQEKEFPTILYFHGNGETATDHDWVARLYIQRGVNFFVTEYRGYGLSNGKPNITNLVRDCHIIFSEFKKVIEEEGYKSSIFVMGRSLGSIPAVELAYHYQDQFKGLIIESGAANNFRVLWNFLEASEQERLSSDKFINKEKIRSIRIPTCIIHGEYDQLIPVQEGVELYENSGAVDKDILIISGADHNDLMLTGHDQYFNKIEEFVRKNA